MAKEILYNASVLVNSVDLSDHVESVEVQTSIKEQEASAMGDDQTYSMPGLKDVGDVKINFYQDFATSKVYATINPLWSARTIFNVVIKKDSGATAPTNPLWTIPVFVKTAQFVNGKHGDRHMVNATFANAGVIVVTTA